ncbi:MAG: hypothetical protein Q9163_005225 [Psora crenata]
MTDRPLQLRSQSLQAPYLDSDMQSRYFEFGEDTIIRADQYIRLTSDRQGQSGWLFARMPMTADNWMVPVPSTPPLRQVPDHPLQIEMEFKIHGQGHLHGDGMAIWMTEERGQPGNVFGSRDNFTGLGVFIDTYKNQRPGTVFPYVMAMLGNSSVRYDKDHDGKDNELAGCSARGIRGDEEPQPKRIRLTYFAENYLKVELQHKKENPDEWTECFETGPIKLPQTAYLGFSAETGELTDNHDIISVTTHNLHIRQNTGPDRSKDASGPRPGVVKSQPYNPGGEKERGSWRWFLLKMVLFGIVVVGGYVGYTMYRASKNASRF